jgi:hypothetical protein
MHRRTFIQTAAGTALADSCRTKAIASEKPKWSIGRCNRALTQCDAGKDLLADFRRWHRSIASIAFSGIG